MAPEGDGGGDHATAERLGGDPLLQAIAESPLQALLLIEIEPFRIEWANAACAEMLGIAPTAWRTISLAGMLARVHEDERGALADRFARRQRSEDVPDRFRTRFLRPDGRVRWIEGVLRPLQLGGRRLVLGAFLDVTSHLEAVAGIEASEARYRVLFEEMNDAAFLADAETGILIDANKRAEELMGRPRSELLGLHQQHLHPPGEAERYREKFRDHVAHGHARDFDGEIVRPDGSRRPVAISAAIYEQRGRRYNLGIFRDLTESRRQEAERLRFHERMLLAQKRESLGLLAGGIAHDFNNLLQAMLGNADLLRLDVPPGSPTLELVDQIRAAAREAAGLVRQLLNYAGRGVATLRDVDLNELVRDMAELLRVSVPRTVTLELAPSRGSAPVRADPTQVRQVLMNLIVNAAEAVGERRGRVRLATGDCPARAETHEGSPAVWIERPTAETCVFLEVQDDGCGIDADSRARIFDPFFSTKAQGRGLGLAVVLGIVRAHGAGLELRSEPGCGTTVRVHFPRTADAAPLRPSQAAPPGEFRGSGLVLVVDDEEAPRLVARAMLERLGFATQGAADGETAIEEFRRTSDRLAAVVLDLTMPGTAGDRVLAELRLIRPDVPVVMVSGYEEPALRDGLRPDAFVHKPFVLEELVEALRRVMPRG
ncbi:MAG: PAS domain S-box protein [Deltaproteobacteria bacterium]|nr:PAS domain S-box protein [Deltaproteobacteria bacterium]